ncbi:MAG TPA: hypothetical protein PJ989_05080 [Oligoflexia bacterium]|nr:hypothetical protein [Oligoflexia bacterium]
MLRKFSDKIFISALLFGSVFFLVSKNSLADGIPEFKSHSDNKINVSGGSGINKENKKDKLPPYSLPDLDLKKYQYCGKDSDCVQVVNGCCQCLQGDPMTAINRSHLADFERQFSCSKVKCSPDSKTHTCMDGVVSCINHRCTYFPPE